MYHYLGSKISESFVADKGKSGTQESSKSGTTAKAAQQMKKSHSTQEKTGVGGKGEETKTGGLNLREKDQEEDSSRAKDGKIKTSRVKAESLSRDDHSQLSPKPDESLFKMKDEKTKISKVKVEKSSASGGHSASVAGHSSSLNSQDEKSSSCKGTRENFAQSQSSPAGESGVSQGEVEAKVEKANDNGSYVGSSLEYKVKVKEERSKAFGGSENSESATIHLHVQQEEVVKTELKPPGESEKERGKKLLDEGTSKIGAGVQRNENFMRTSFEEKSDKDAEWHDVCVSHIESESKVKELESSEQMLATHKQTEIVEQLERKVENKQEGKKGLEPESSLRMKNATASDLSRVKDIEIPASKYDEELITERAAEMTCEMDESQKQTAVSDENSLLSKHKDVEVKAESVSEKTDLEASFMSRECVGEASSAGEYSDGESDISEVSSVHTSDLSSFDEEISSSSESYDQGENERAGETETSKNEHQEMFSAQPQSSEQVSDAAAPRRRSTRISSRRSTKEGESEVSEGEGSDIRTSSIRKRRHGEKRERKPRPETAKGQRESGREKRGRGRPRKDDRRASDHSSSQMRRSRTHVRDGSRRTGERTDSTSGEDRTKRSQRTIKRTRCYSPSSEGTREVFLPRKRSRDAPS